MIALKINNICDNKLLLLFTGGHSGRKDQFCLAFYSAATGFHDGLADTRNIYDFRI